tara:strand:- start:7194 stop:7592 length:399 start_codon:yes stop_codon:yes gene_type:complete
MTVASREALLKLCERRYATVDIPEREVTVRIQSLSESEKSQYETCLIAKNGKGIMRERLQDATRRLLALCIVDDAGERIFSDGDLSALANLDAFVSSRIYDACQEHCGFNKGDIDDTVKNSEQISVDDSTTD